MPRRADIERILIIGSGPIVIGQAAEFDFSGTQACKVAARGRLRGRPRQLQPGDDHDRPRVGRPRPTSSRSLPRRGRPRSSRRSGPTPSCRAGRPDGAQPRLGARRARHRWSSTACELIGTQLDAIAQGRGPRPLQEDDGRASACDVPEGGRRPHARGGAADRSSRLGLPVVIRPAYTLGGTGGGIAERRGVRADRRAAACGSRRSTQVLIEESRARLEGVRVRGHARPQGQLSSSSARSRTSTRWASTRATRIDGRARADALRRATTSAPRRRHHAIIRALGIETGGSQRPVRRQPGTGGDRRHRDQPARVALLGARVARRPASRSPSRRASSPSANARRDPQRRHQDDAGQLRARDRLRRHKDPALAFEKFRRWTPASARR